MSQDRDLEFKQRLQAVLADLESAGRRDSEAMWLLGGLASGLANEFRESTWSLAKRRMSRSAYDVLIEKFRNEGNAFHKDGRKKHAYAIQALAMSLIAPTQPDAEVRKGGELLDRLIDKSILYYRQSVKSRQ